MSATSISLLFGRLRMMPTLLPAILFVTAAVVTAQEQDPDEDNIDLIYKV